MNTTEEHKRNASTYGRDGSRDKCITFWAGIVHLKFTKLKTTYSRRNKAPYSKFGWFI